MTNQERRNYQAFLLRMWRTDDGWQLELQSAETMQKTLLLQVDDLVPFIRAQVANDPAKETLP